jgi:AraC-like DNA-binding protein
MILHPSHHAHANLFGRRGARVLNIPLPPQALALDSYVVLTASEPERLASCSWSAAVLEVLEMAGQAPRAAARLPCSPWIDEFAARLRLDAETGSRTPLHELAKTCDVTAPHASRAFAAHFGLSPSRFRREHRLRAAYRRLRAGASPSAAACGVGFADQSHLTRELKRFAGTTPARLRDHSQSE